MQTQKIAFGLGGRTVLPVRTIRMIRTIRTIRIGALPS
jgi:hypothetical protein